MWKKHIQGYILGTYPKVLNHDFSTKMFLINGHMIKDLVEKFKRVSDLFIYACLSGSLDYIAGVPFSGY